MNIEQAIRNSREKAGGMCGDCETAVMYLMKIYPKKDGNGRNFGPGVHDWFIYGDKILDPTAAQFTELCSGETHHKNLISTQELIAKGLLKAVKTGIFSHPEHEKFRRMVKILMYS